MSDAVLLEKRPPLASVTLSRRVAMTTLDFATTDELLGIWREFRGDDDRLRGAGDEYAISGGLELTCDLRIRSRHAQFRVTRGAGGVSTIATAAMSGCRRAFALATRFV